MLDGLEATELKLSEVLAEDRNLRIESEFFKKDYLDINSLIARHRVKYLEDLSAKVSDGTHFTPIYQESGIPFLSAINVKENYLDLTANYKFISVEDHRELYKRCDPKPRDVILRKVGVGPRWACVVPEGIFEFSIFVSVAQVRSKEEYLNPYYLAAYINSSLGQTQLLRFNKGIGQPDLHLEEIRKLKIPLLGKAFQIRVEQVTKAAHQKLDQSKALYAEAESLLLDELELKDWQPSDENIAVKSFAESFGSTGRLDAEYYQPAALGLIATIREGDFTKLGDHANVMSGYPWKSENFIEEPMSGEPFIRIRDCKPGAIDINELDCLVAEYANKEGVTKAVEGDLVIGMDGVKYFYASLIISACYVNQRVCHVRLQESSPFSPEFALLVLDSLVGQTQLLREMTIAQTVGHITNENVRELLIPILPEEQINRITKLVKDSIIAKFDSKRLLDIARRGVEIAIEQDEAAALEWMEQEGMREQ